MTTADPQDARHQARRWLDEGQSLLGVLLSILDGYDRVSDRVNTAERENARLRAAVVENEHLRQRLELAEHECRRLGEELGQRGAELEQSRREREEIADQLTLALNDVLLRLRSHDVAGLRAARSF